MVQKNPDNTFSLDFDEAFMAEAGDSRRSPNPALSNLMAGVRLWIYEMQQFSTSESRARLMVVPNHLASHIAQAIKVHREEALQPNIDSLTNMGLHGTDAYREHMAYARKADEAVGALNFIATE